MGPYYAAVEAVRVVSLLAGSLVIFAGILRAAGERDRARVARRIADHAALGLEFFIAATILTLILDPTWASVAATAFTIAIRQLMTVSLRLAQAG